MYVWGEAKRFAVSPRPLPSRVLWYCTEYEAPRAPSSTRCLPRFQCSGSPSFPPGPGPGPWLWPYLCRFNETGDTQMLLQRFRPGALRPVPPCPPLGKPSQVIQPPLPTSSLAFLLLMLCYVLDRVYPHSFDPDLIAIRSNRRCRFSPLAAPGSPGRKVCHSHCCVGESIRILSPAGRQTAAPRAIIPVRVRPPALLANLPRLCPVTTIDEPICRTTMRQMHRVSSACAAAWSDATESIRIPSPALHPPHLRSARARHEAASDL